MEQLAILDESAGNFCKTHFLLSSKRSKRRSESRRMNKDVRYVYAHSASGGKRRRSAFEQ
jgi:hypothetical protein